MLSYYQINFIKATIANLGVNEHFKNPGFKIYSITKE